MAITSIEQIKTPAHVKEVLEKHSGIDTVHVPKNPTTDNRSTIKRITIDYRLKGGQSVRRGKIEMEAEGEGDYLFVKGVPSILRQILEPAPASPAQRDFHFTMAQVVQWFSDTGKTLLDEDEVRVSREGKFDRVTARLIVTETTGEGKDAVTTEFVTPFEALVNKDAQGNAIVRQVK